MNKKILIILILILLAIGVIGGYFGYKYYSEKYGIGKDVLVVVDDEKITKKDLNERIYGIDFQGSPDNPTTHWNNDEKKEILEELVQWRIAEQETPKLGISISEDELNEEINSRLGTLYDSYDSFQKDFARKAILNDLRIIKIKEKVIGWQEGAVILARFDKSYESGADVSSPKIVQTVKADKTYAQNLINEVYQDIISNRITFEQGVEKTNNDPKIGKPAWNGGLSYTFSRKFSREESKDRGVLAASRNFWDEIFNVDEGKISEPKLYSIDDTSENGSHEAFFAIIKVDKANKAEYKSFEDWLSAKKAEYNAKYYYENL